jgi:hypothetical protein
MALSVAEINAIFNATRSNKFKNQKSPKHPALSAERAGATGQAKIKMTNQSSK